MDRCGCWPISYVALASDRRSAMRRTAAWYLISARSAQFSVIPLSELFSEAGYRLAQF